MLRLVEKFAGFLSKLCEFHRESRCFSGGDARKKPLGSGGEGNITKSKARGNGGPGQAMDDPLRMLPHWKPAMPT